jgi:hypothetical protein
LYAVNSQEFCSINHLSERSKKVKLPRSCAILPILGVFARQGFAFLLFIFITSLSVKTLKKIITLHYPSNVLGKGAINSMRSPDTGWEKVNFQACSAMPPGKDIDCSLRCHLTALHGIADAGNDRYRIYARLHIFALPKTYADIGGIHTPPACPDEPIQQKEKDY